MEYYMGNENEYNTTIGINMDKYQTGYVKWKQQITKKSIMKLCKNIQTEKLNILFMDICICD